MIPSRSRALCLSTFVAIFSLCPGVRLHAGPTPPDKTVEAAPEQDDRFQFAYETAVNLGINNPNNYIINPQIFELRWQPWHAEQFFHTPFVFIRQWEIAAAAVPFLAGAGASLFRVRRGHAPHLHQTGQPLVVVRGRQTDRRVHRLQWSAAMDRARI